MVIQASILRTSDGLPLSASTDVDPRASVKSCQRYIKLLTKNLCRLPDRCTLSLEGFNIHLLTSAGLSYVLLCDDSYATVLAFCFLDEIQREFTSKYDDLKILNVRRPYAFIEFDMFLHKLKNRYNNPRSLTTRVNLADMSAELRLRPPYQVNEDDLGLVDNGILKPRKDTHRPVVAPGRVLLPLNWVGMLSIALNIFCAALNIMRGMAVIGHGHFDEADSGAYRYAAAFLTTALLYSAQVYLMLYKTRWRVAYTLALLGGHSWSSYYIIAFRDTVHTIFYVAVTLFATVVIATRQGTDKLPGYSI